MAVAVTMAVAGSGSGSGRGRGWQWQWRAHGNGSRSGARHSALARGRAWDHVRDHVRDWGRAAWGRVVAGHGLSTRLGFRFGHLELRPRHDPHAMHTRRRRMHLAALGGGDSQLRALVIARFAVVGNAGHPAKEAKPQSAVRGIVANQRPWWEGMHEQHAQRRGAVRKPRTAHGGTALVRNVHVQPARTRFRATCSRGRRPGCRAGRRVEQRRQAAPRGPRDSRA